MIKSLYQINKALVDLSTELSNPKSSNQMIRKSIQNLLSEVKYLEQQEKFHYYLLISEIYASRFNNVEQAQNELEVFRKSLNTEISMNCELRIAFFKYFKQDYKQAYQHLDSGLGQVEQQPKYSQNAKFFFDRALNKNYLIKQTKQNKNFEACFILSLIYEHQKQQSLAFKQIQAFLSHTNEHFSKFQIYKRLLQLYEVMRKNNISTISISKKSLENYKQELQFLQNKYFEFQQNYQYKYRFVTKIIAFFKKEDKRNQDKIVKKQLQLKLLAYYKLKKCSRHAPNQYIKKTLQNTAKLIRMSKDTELLDSTLNYDFVKKEYEQFKVFHRLASREDLAKWKFFNALVNFEQPVIQFAKKQKPQIMFATSKPQSILKNPVQSQMTKTQPVQQKQIPSPMTETSAFVMKQTDSQLMNDSFEGSKMIKLHATSEGSEERYFYVRLQSIKSKPRIYYCNSKKEKSENDSYYSLKGLEKISRGKNTPAFKRKDAVKYDEMLCFALIFDNGKDRSFYVPNQDDYQRWIILLQTKVLYADANMERMEKTMNTPSFSKKLSKGMIQSEYPSQLKKSRRIVEII